MDLQNSDVMSVVGDFGIWYVVFLFSLTLHEAAHALVGWLGGDDTAYSGGQVTLNPWPHVRREPFGTVIVPLASFFFSGWMMGWASAPYDPEWARRHPRRQALMAAAGPLANLLLAVIVFLVAKTLLGAGLLAAPQRVNFSQIVVPAADTPEGSWVFALAFALSVALSLNLLLFIFNLIPLPPLDGSGVIQGLFPDSIGRYIETAQRNPMIILMGLVLLWRGVGYVYWPALTFVLSLLHPGYVYG